MKKIVCCLIFFLFATHSFAKENSLQVKSDNNTNGSERTSVIDAQDTVVFDISRATIVGNTVEFPVYIHTNDSVNALDFSFKFNEAGFTYDTILNLTTYLQAYSFYNTSDSTVRFTSNTLHTIAIDTPLVMLRFTSLSGQLCSSDLNTIDAYLNGDVCSNEVITCVISGVAEATHGNQIVSIYPNPANTVLNVTSSEKCSLQLITVSGSRLILDTEVEADQSAHIPLQVIPKGIYLMKVFNSNFVSVQKIVIE